MTKNIKKFFIAVISLMVVLTFLVLGTARTFAVVGDNGYAVPASSEISRSLNSASGDALSFVPVGSEDVVYRKLSRYYVGDSRTGIDVTYPIWVGGGSALRFLDDENWLITADIDLLRTYDGLYLSEGSTYTEDLAQADPDEFILLALSNGLYLNAQQSVFTSAAGSRIIPANSVLLFSDSAIRWYTPQGASLHYDEEEAVFDATLQIGEHSYSYASLLRALGLVNEAIQRAESGKDNAEQLKEAEVLLSGSGNTGNHSGATADGTGAVNGEDGEIGDNSEGNAAGAGDAAAAGDTAGADAAAGDGAGDSGSDGSGASASKSGPSASSIAKKGSAAQKGTSSSQKGTSGSGSGSGSNGNGSGDAGADSGSAGGSGDGSDLGNSSNADGTSSGESAASGETASSETASSETASGETASGETASGESATSESATGENADGDTEKGEGSNTTGTGDGTADGGGSITGGDDSTREDGGDISNLTPETGEGADPDKIAPAVSVSNFNLWCYAFNAKLTIDDPTASLPRGVRVTLYKSLSGHVSPTPIRVENGYEVYSADEGRSTLARRTLNSTQEFTLSPLQPGLTVYLQYTYRYDTEEVVGGKEAIVRKTYASDFYKIKLPTVAEGNVYPVAAGWETGFAVSPTAMQLTNITLANTSDYDAAKTDFANFKKNTMTYANRLVYTLTPVDASGHEGTSVEIAAGSSIISRIKQEGSATFLSGSPKLEPNTHYRYTSELRDRYGYTLPMQMDGVENTPNGDIYTAKTVPTVEIAEVSNITDSLTISVTVHDPDGALQQENGSALPLRLVAAEPNGTAASLNGKWVDDSISGNAAFDESDQGLLLPSPADGRVYTLRIDSLAFAQTYVFTVAGGYDPQPTGVTSPVRPAEQAVFGTQRIYTASLSTGNVSFSMGYPRTKDSSATVTAQMTTSSTMSILPLVDEFRLTVAKKGNSTVVGSATLAMNRLNSELPTLQSGYTYNDALGGIVLQESDEATHTPQIVLVGEKKVFQQYNLWQSLFPQVDSTSETGNVTYSTPAQMVVSFPEGTFVSSTNYVVSLQSVVIKSGREYQIPTKLSLNNFTTSKIQPKLQLDDIVAASENLDFTGVRMYDPDGTILNDGQMRVELWFGPDTLMSVKTLTASAAEDSPTTQIHFEGLIQGAEYTVKFIAPAFNDGDTYYTYQQNYLVKSYTILGGSSLNGDIELLSLGKGTQEKVPVFSLTGAEVAQRIQDTKDGIITNYYKKWPVYTEANYNQYYTEYFEVPEGVNFITIENFYLQNIAATNNNVTVQYFKENYAGKGSYGMAANGLAPTFYVPAETKWVRLIIPVSEGAGALLQEGLTVSGNTAPFVNQFDELSEEDIGKGYALNANNQHNPNNTVNTYYFDVAPGEKYIWELSAWNTAYFFNSDGRLINTLEQSNFSEFTIPEGITRMAISASTGWTKKLYRTYSPAESGENGFAATVKVSTHDDKGYLAVGIADLETQSPFATLRLYVSDTVQALEYGENPAKTQRLPLALQEDGSWELADSAQGLANEMVAQLEAGKGYKLVLSVDYGGEIVLDTLAFQTDADYSLIHNQFELLQISQNPYGNYLVVSDFVQTVNTPTVALYGTVDFQGHTVTRAPGVTGNLFGTIQAGGKVSNLVYEYPAGYNVPDNSGRICYTLSGTIENLIVRTAGDLIDSSQYGIIAFNVAQGGVLRNFVVKLGGDVTFNTSGVGGLLMCRNYGLVENGYVYAITGRGVIYPASPNGNARQFGILMGENYPSGETRNVFTKFDTWILENSTGSNMGALMYQAYYDVHNLYHVGDFYQYFQPPKNTRSPFASERLLGTYYTLNNTPAGNLYYFAEREYTANSTKFVARDLRTLYDATWQQNQLGSEFDAEGCVSMGFFPRLKLPISMQKNQEYIQLPSVGGSAPTIASDGWTLDDAGNPVSQNADSGFITLRFNNPGNAIIESVTIGSLVVDRIISQQLASDGLYDVQLAVKTDPLNLAYLSSYVVTQISYSTGSSIKTSSPNYKTTGFEFWKEVSSATDWQQINSHMNWNYRLTQDIDFSQRDSAGNLLVPGAIMLNGNLTNPAGGGWFSGKLDGQNHTISNITLTETNYPYVIYGCNTGAVVKNLKVDSLTLQAGSTAGNAAGFIRQASGTELTNLHISNSSVTGHGYVGGLVGQAYSSIVSECSVVDSTLNDDGASYAARFGGLIGHFSEYLAQRCFVRNVNINVTKSPTVDGVGGIFGYCYRTVITGVYATGKITVTGNNAGGLIGRTDNDHCVVNGAWTNVTLDVTGNNAGGLVGYNCNYNYGTVSMGNIISTGLASRTLGYTSNEAYSQGTTGLFAYAGQSVNNMKETDRGNARMLLSGDQLNQKTVWVDTVKAGTCFDYAPLSQGYCPKLLSETGGLIPGQTDIPLPGQGGDHTLRVNEAEYAQVEGSYRYRLSAVITHPGYTTAEMQAMLANDTLVVTMDGMNLEKTQQEVNNASVTLDENTTQENSSLLSVWVKEITGINPTQMTDLYRLTVAYPAPNGIGEPKALTSQVDFGHAPSWRVSNLTEWNNLMAAGHGTNNENFTITGAINFGGESTPYTALKLGFLKGEGGNAGFYNLNYTALNGKGGSWIDSIYSTVEDLTFANITATFPSGGENRGITGLVLMGHGLKNCVFQDNTLNTYGNQATDFGFFAVMEGDVENLTLSGLTLKVLTGGGNVVGNLVGYLYGSFLDVNAENLTVEAVNAQCVGGVFGNTAALAGLPKQYCSGNFKDITVTTEYQHVGAVVGQYLLMADGITVDNATITGTQYVGGISGDGNGDTKMNLVVKNSKIVSTSTTAAIAAGGIFAYMGWGIERGIRVENVEIVGKGFVGGIAARCDAGHFYDVQVLGCTITSEPGNTNARAGGLFGMRYIGGYTLAGIVVRGTTITSAGAAGGIIGDAVKNGTDIFKLKNSYVAEDVTVTSTAGAAGGLVGSASGFDIKDCAVGATVTGAEGVGGLIGTVAVYENVTPVRKLTNSYVVGQISGSNYVGGVVGKVDSSLGTEFTTENLNGVVVAANITCSGEKSSLWLNNTAKQGAPGDGYVFVTDSTLLNSQTAAGLVAADAATGTVGIAMPVSSDGKSEGSKQGIFGAEKLQEETFYTETVGFNTVANDDGWDFTRIKPTEEHSEYGKYMPFTKFKENANKTVAEEPGLYMPFTDYKFATYGVEGQTKEENGIEAGILMPNAANEPLGVAVYTTGADTINIETGRPNTVVTVTAGAATSSPTTDANGVITVGYDFASSVQLDGTTIVSDPETLKRSIMAWGSTWYYIKDDGNIGYGGTMAAANEPIVLGKGTTDEDTTDESAPAQPVTALHLWQGYALGSDGNLYSLDGGKAAFAGSAAELMADMTVRYLTEVSVSTITGPVNIRIFHNFSLYGDTLIEQRLFASDNRIYPISPRQNVVQDGILLNTRKESDITTRYFALLGTDGKLTNYLAELNLGKLSPEGILQITNNFNYTEPILVARYADGVVAVNYTNGNTLLNTRPTLVTFMAYARSNVSNLFASLSGTRNDPSFMQGEQEAGIVTTPGNSQGSTETGGNGGAETGSAGGEGGESLPGADMNGLNTAEGLNEERGTGLGEGAAAGAAGEAPAETTAAVPQAGQTAWYQPGEGVYLNDVLVLPEGSAEYRAGEGVYVNGVLAYAEQAGGSVEDETTGTAGETDEVGGTTETTETEAGNPAEAAGTETGENTGTDKGKRVKLVATEAAALLSAAAQQAAQQAQQLAEAEASRKMLLQALGEKAVVYNPLTQQYEAVDTEVLLDGEPEKAVEPTAAELETPAEQQEADRKNTFTIGRGFAHGLTKAERNGFILLGAVAVALMIVLAALYFYSVKKKHDQEQH